MLNFDPRKWLADNASGESGNFVANVATVAATLPKIEKTHPGADWGKSEKSVLNFHPATVATPATVAEWTRQLSRLDRHQPPEGFALGRWQSLCADALWLAESYGDQAMHLGWTASDLFGLDPLPGWGGLADRLEGARSVTFTSTVAHWIGKGNAGWLWRRTLTPKPPIWEPFEWPATAGPQLLDAFTRARGAYDL